MTKYKISKLSTFDTNNLRQILWIFWPRTISTKNWLHYSVIRITWKPWSCEGDGNSLVILWRKQDNITHTALHWTPERWRGQPKSTWWHIVDSEMRTTDVQFRKWPRIDSGVSPYMPTKHFGDHHRHVLWKGDTWISMTTDVLKPGNALLFRALPVAKKIK